MVSMPPVVVEIDQYMSRMCMPEFGNVLDDNGCQICQCNDALPPPTDRDCQHSEKYKLKYA